MKIKKILALLLAAVMMFALVAACAADPVTADPEAPPTPPPAAEATPTPEPGEDPAPEVADGMEGVRANTLIVGHNHAIGGNFVGGFTNAAVDLDVLDLLFAHSLFYFEDDGLITVNPTAVAGEPVITDDAEGNRTYTWTINSGLLWSDGREITAYDYAADVLWRASAIWADDVGAGWSRTVYMNLLGRDAYHEGESEYFAGVQVLDNNTLAVTINHENLPFFWEPQWASVAPIPLHHWAPSVSVVSNENGIRFDGDITDYMFAVAEDQVWAMSVTSGGYTLIGWENEIATLQRNPLFSGDPWGRMPTIEYVQVIVVPSEVDVDNLFAGDVDLLPGVLTASKIERVMANPDFAAHGYIRIGYGVINFVHYGDHVGTDVYVRRAFAHTLDRQGVLDHVLGGFGSLIDTMASPGQWMWRAVQARALEQMIEYTFSVEQAIYWLDQTEWLFEEDGVTPWNPELATTDQTYLRHNAAGEPLIFRMGGGAPDVLEGINLNAPAPASLAGMGFVADFVDFMGVIIPSLNAPWDLDEITHYAFAMGFGFTPVVDPYFSFHTNNIGTASNPAFSDPVMDDILVRMRETDSADVDQWLEAYLEFVIRFNYMLPTLPLYNNIWHDMYNPRIEGLSAVNDFNGWAQHISALSLTRAP